MESSSPAGPGATASQALPQAFGTLTFQPRRWWVVSLLGLLSIVAGTLAIVYSGITLLVLGIVFGINLLLLGILWVVVTVDEDTGGGAGHVLRLLVGFFAILAGLLCLVRPGASVLALLVTVAFWFVLTGVADLARAFSEPEGRFVSGLLGLIGIAVGVVLVADPDIGLETLALLAGIGFIVRGVVELCAGIYIRRLAS